MTALLAACGPWPPRPADKTPPSWPEHATMTVSSVSLTVARLSWPAAWDASVNGTDRVLRYRVSRDGQAMLETTALATEVTGLVTGESHVFKVEAGDPAGNWTSSGPAADVAGAPPAPQAPPLDRSVATRVCEATRFLYTGPAAIQQGVTPGSLHCEAIALIRGRVLSDAGSGLGGVQISIQGMPQWGTSLTQDDGQFDFVVEAGQHTVAFSRSGHLPAHRLVTLAPQQWGHAPEVVLLKADAAVTEITLSQGGMHAARARNDDDGTRTTWLYFAPGTQAAMTLPDGSTRPLATIHVRATEYTVGPRGEAAMPASLPATTNYGFAMELSVDEAIAAGADGVQFTEPVRFFVDNFLGLPPGTVIPAGFYDRKRARWIADNDARVVSLVSVTDGKANFDLDGDGTADALPGASDAERTEVARWFAVGAQLWRGTRRHFSAADLNFNEKCSASSCATPRPDPDVAPPVADSAHTCGSDIDCHNQTLGEDIAVAGTPFTLRYQSDRSVKPGQGAAFRLDIPWVGGTDALPGDVVDAQLDIDIAGKRWTKTHAGKPSPGESESFVWDGRDAWGRAPQGPMPVVVTLGYRNRSVRGRPVLGDFNFLETGGEPFTAKAPGRGGVVVERAWRGQLGTWYADAIGLGGLSLSAVHQYAPSEGRLYRGDGSMVQADALGPTLDLRVGGGNSNQDGVPGTQTHVFLPAQLARGPDGALYFNDGAAKVRRMAPDGTVRTVVGDAPGCQEGDGIPATSACLTSVTGLAVDRQGNLYITDTARHRIYRIDASSVIRPFAGTGVRGDSGDGGDALTAQLRSPAGIAVTADGDAYVLAFAGSPLQMVMRRVRNGVITTVAGGGTVSDSTIDQVDARAVVLKTSSESQLALGPDGSVYFSELAPPMVRRLAPDGKIYRVAGSARGGFGGDGGPALAALLDRPGGLAVTSDGSVYICDTNNHRVRRVRPDGTIETVAGTGTRGSQGAVASGVLALRAIMTEPQGLALLPDGAVAVTERGGGRIRVLRLTRAALVGPDTLLLPREDGSELYVFNAGGKHLRTLAMPSKALKYELTYTTSGALAQVRDGSGNATEVVRDGNGQPLGLRSPDGLMTTIKLDAEARAIAVTNPAHEETRLAYGTDGLLASLTDARGNTSRFEYDSTGRLIKDSNAAGGSKSLRRVVDHGTTSITVTTAETRTTKHDRRMIDGADVRSTRFADGTVAREVRNADGSIQRESPDGTIVREQLAGDPRFGMAAPFVEATVTRMPSGLERTVRTTRTVTLAKPDDVLSDTKMEEVTTINGKAWKDSWDAATRTLTRTTPLGRQSSLRFDDKGQPIESIIPGTLPTTMSYDQRGRLILVAQGARTTAFGWNNAGFLGTTTDALGRVATSDDDNLGRPTKVTRPDGAFRQLRYDAVGNLVALTPPEKPEHVFGYTSVSSLASYEPPQLPGVGGERYAYDLDASLVTITHPDGTTSQYRRDGGGRLTKLIAPWGAYDFVYDETSGQSTSAVHLGQTLAWTYDGSLPIAETATGTVSGTVGYAYDNDLRVTAVSVNGIAVPYTYDDDGLLIKVGSLSLARNPGTGQLVSGTLGTVTSGWAYDQHGDLTGSTATVAAGLIFQELLTRDPTGRITAKTETIGGTTVNWTYSYDLAGRLQAVAKNGTITSTYAYDGNGNRTLANGVASAFDSQDRQLSAGALQFKYDAFGSLIEKRDTATLPIQVTRYQYDGNGGLRKLTLPDGRVLDYLVDARGRRVANKRNGALEHSWLYDGQLRIVAELDGSGVVVSRFAYAALAYSPDYLEREGVSYRLIHDDLGSIRLVVNAATGAVAQRIDYDEWGQILVDTAPGFQPFAFAGGLYDADSKLVHFGARDYNPRTGRWTTKDPIRMSAEDANLYAYAFDDPVNSLDPSGLDPPCDAPRRPALLPKDAPTKPFPWSPPKPLPPEPSPKFSEIKDMPSVKRFLDKQDQTLPNAFEKKLQESGLPRVVYYHVAPISIGF